MGNALGEVSDLTIYDDENGWYRYRGWKIQRLLETRFQAVRIRPTEYFVGTSLQACVKSIDRREGEREKLRMQLLCGTIDGNS